MEADMGRRRTYLEMKSVPEALELLDSAVGADRTDEELVPVLDSLGRVTSRAVFAASSNPAYRAAAMDGYAVHSADLAEASEMRPVTLEVGSQALDVDTGDEMPEGFDAVIMAEDVWPGSGSGTIQVPVPASRWQHVRKVGEDVVEGELVVSSCQHIEPRHVAVLLASGYQRVWVRRPPRVGLIPTGDEVVEPGGTLEPGQVPEFDSKMLAAMVVEWGGSPVPYGVVRDDPGRLRAAVERALAECDLVVLIAGTSAGRDDYAPSVLSEMGELLVHGVNVMPGKPTALARVKGKLVLGLPGYPVSTAVAADLFLHRAMALLLGVGPAERPRVPSVLARKVPSKAGHREVIRVLTARVGEETVSVPLARGAGMISSLARAGGLVILDEHTEGVEEGDRVEVELLSNPGQISRTVLHVGSHDLCLDVVGELLRERSPGWALASVSVGSLAGLAALARGRSHVAGIHVRDEETGTYNLPAARRMMRGRPAILVRLAGREQGLYVPKGNPKGIGSIEDLTREDVTMVNRQAGSGTRILLDHLLAEAGLDASAVRGYEVMEATHTAVAEAVRSGLADTGLGIRLAAHALGLDFVPLVTEPYDLVIPADFLETEAVGRLLDVLRSPRLVQVISGLAGYHAEETGLEVGKTVGP